MFEELTEIAWYGWPLVAVVVFAFTMWRLRHSRARSRIGAALSLSAASALALVFLALSAMFRDGLAPGLVPSTGTTAIRRTVEGLPPLALVIPLVAVGWWASKPPRSDSTRGAG